jgi:hypothetical protein
MSKVISKREFNINTCTSELEVALTTVPSNPLRTKWIQDYLTQSFPPDVPQLRQIGDYLFRINILNDIQKNKLNLSIKTNQLRQCYLDVYTEVLADQQNPTQLNQMFQQLSITQTTATTSSSTNNLTIVRPNTFKFSSLYEWQWLARCLCLHAASVNNVGNQFNSFGVFSDHFIVCYYNDAIDEIKVKQLAIENQDISFILSNIQKQEERKEWLASLNLESSTQTAFRYFYRGSLFPLTVVLDNKPWQINTFQCNIRCIKNQIKQNQINRTNNSNKSSLTQSPPEHFLSCFDSILIGDSIIKHINNKPLLYGAKQDGCVYCGLAIVIGISDSSGNSCIIDALAMSEALNKVGFEICLLIDCDSVQLENTLKWASSETIAKSRDALCIFYSGHGSDNWISLIDPPGYHLHQLWGKFEGDSYNQPIPAADVGRVTETNYWKDKPKILISNSCRWAAPQSNSEIYVTPIDCHPPKDKRGQYIKAQSTLPRDWLRLFSCVPGAYTPGGSGSYIAHTNCKSTDKELMTETDALDKHRGLSPFVWELYSRLRKITLKGEDLFTIAQNLLYACGKLEEIDKLNAPTPVLESTLRRQLFLIAVATSNPLNFYLPIKNL